MAVIAIFPWNGSIDPIEFLAIGPGLIEVDVPKLYSWVCVSASGSEMCNPRRLAFRSL